MSDISYLYDELIIDSKLYNEDTLNESITTIENLNIDATLNDLMLEASQICASQDLQLEADSIIKDAFIRFWEKVKYFISKIIEAVMDFFRNISHWFRYNVLRFYEKLKKKESIINEFFGTNKDLTIVSKSWKEDFPINQYEPDIKIILEKIPELTKEVREIFADIEKNGFDDYLSSSNIDDKEIEKRIEVRRRRKPSIKTRLFSILNIDEKPFNTAIKIGASLKDAMGSNDTLYDIRSKQREFTKYDLDYRDASGTNVRTIGGMVKNKFFDSEHPEANKYIKQLFPNASKMMEILSPNVYKTFQRGTEHIIKELKYIERYSDSVSKRAFIKRNDAGMMDMSINNLRGQLNLIREPLNIYIELLRAYWRIFYLIYRDALRSALAIIKNKN